MLRDTILNYLKEGKTEDEIATEISKIMNDTFAEHKDAQEREEKKEKYMCNIFDAIKDYFEELYPEVEIEETEYSRLLPIMVKNFDKIAAQSRYHKTAAEKADPVSTGEKMDPVSSEEDAKSEPDFTYTVDTYEKRSGEPEKRTHKEYSGAEAWRQFRDAFKE